MMHLEHLDRAASRKTRTSACVADLDHRHFEMSRYIDLDLYHEVERSHPFYLEMTDCIMSQVMDAVLGRPRVCVLEIGAGTGIMTKELLRLSNIDLDALDFDEDCCERLRKNVSLERCRVIVGDAVTYCRPGYYDLVVSSFAHDHIHYDRRHAFAANLCRNLRPGGLYVMGGELLPEFRDAAEHERSLMDYHCYIVDKALRQKHYRLAQIEINALESGVDMIGDFKRHEKMFEEEMASSGMTLALKEKMGPLDRSDCGGVFVYVYRKARDR